MAAWSWALAWAICVRIFAMCSVPQRVQQWFQAKQTGWYAVLEDPQTPCR
jgi:hypothetical protein